MNEDEHPLVRVAVAMERIAVALESTTQNIPGPTWRYSAGSWAQAGSAGFNFLLPGDSENK